VYIVNGFSLLLCNGKLFLFTVKMPVSSGHWHIHKLIPLLIGSVLGILISEHFMRLYSLETKPPTLWKVWIQNVCGCFNYWDMVLFRPCANFSYNWSSLSLYHQYAYGSCIWIGAYETPLSKNVCVLGWYSSFPVCFCSSDMWTAVFLNRLLIYVS